MYDRATAKGIHYTMIHSNKATPMVNENVIFRAVDWMNFRNLFQKKNVNLDYEPCSNFYEILFTTDTDP